MVGLICRVFPRKPILGIALAVVILVESAAVADHLIASYVVKVQEGSWTLTATRSLSGGMTECTYSRSDDNDQGTQTGTPHKDAWQEDVLGHNASAKQVVSGSCPATPSGGYFSLIYYHKYEVSHSGSH